MSLLLALEMHPSNFFSPDSESHTLTQSIPGSNTSALFFLNLEYDLYTSLCGTHRDNFFFDHSELKGKVTWVTENCEKMVCHD